MKMIAEIKRKTNTNYLGKDSIKPKQETGNRQKKWKRKKYGKKEWNEETKEKNGLNTQTRI